MTAAHARARAPFLRAALAVAVLAGAELGQNLALGRPVTASSFEATSFPEYAVDGDASLTNWWGANPYPQWLQVDLGTVAALDQLRLTTYWDGSRHYQYTIEVSVTGASWNQVIDMSANQAPATAAGFQHDLPGVSARFVRVNMLFNSANPGVHIVELEVGGTPLPPGEIEVFPATLVDLGVQDVNAGPSEEFVILQDSGEPVLGPSQAREIVVTFDPHDGTLVLDERSRVVAADVSLAPLADVVADEIHMLTGTQLATAVGAPTDLEGVAVVTHWGGGYFEQYTAEVSIDGQTWVQIADMSANTQPAGPTGYLHAFPATSARYIRVNTLGNSWLEGQFPRIVEILAREVQTGG